jgi:hypothetical protein
MAVKLTYEILRAELAEHMGCKVFGVKHGCAPIESPQLYEDGMVLSNGYCYVAESVPNEPACWQADALFVICGAGSKTYSKETRGEWGMLCFSKPQSQRQVMNILLDVFTKYRRWTDEMFKILLESGSLSALLHLSLPIFENPLFLIDSRFYLVAEASPDEVSDPDRPMRKVDEAWIVRGKDELLNAGEISTPFFRHLPDDYPRLFINLLEGEYLLGNLSIQASRRPLRESDEYLLTHLAAIVHTAMLRMVASDYDRGEGVGHVRRMLSEIIAGDIVDAEEFSQALSYSGHKRSDQFRCLAIRIPKPSGREFIRNFLQLLGTQIPAMYIPTSGEIAVMIVSVSMAKRQGFEAIPWMEEKMNLLGFHVGLSDVYNDLLLTRYYFAQARYALERGETAQTAQTAASVTLFSECCLDYILENVSGELRPDMLWSEGFRKLIEHDAKGRANYVETLRAYLNNNLNTHRAAAALYISRNSLLAQLERINALLKEDLKDPEVRFRYELSLLLYDLISQTV